MRMLRQLLQLAVGVPVLMTMLGGVCLAQQIPKQFHGVWIVSVAENNACKTSDWDTHENDGLMSVDARGAQYWEATCEPKRVSNGDMTSAELTLACFGEGEVSHSREIWSLVDIGSRRALVMTRLEESASVPADKKVPPMRRQLDARLYLACE